MTDYELAHYLFVYDPEIWGLRWRRKKGTAKPGQIAGSNNKLGYFRVNFQGKLRLVSHIVWLMHTKCWPSKQLDHINRNSLDDRFENLREVDQSLNLQNQVGARENNVSGYRGVSPNKSGGFRATIMVDYKQIHLGDFGTPEAAHEAYLSAKSTFHAGAVLCPAL